MVKKEKLEAVGIPPGPGKWFFGLSADKGITGEFIGEFENAILVVDPNDQTVVIMKSWIMFMAEVVPGRPENKKEEEE